MKVKWILAVINVVAWTRADNIDTAPNRLGQDPPTDKPIQISEQSIDQALYENFENIVVIKGELVTTTPSVTVGRTPSPENIEVPEGKAVTPQVLNTGNNETGEFDNCECVPYYQCDEKRTIIENGEGLIDIRLKSGPCDNYMDVCCSLGDTLSPVNPITAAPPIEPTISTCGKRNVNGVSTLRITGALENEAQFGEFPWVVAIIKKDNINGQETMNVFQCGGSLIGPQVVLTAAHCVEGKKELSVRAGEWDTQSKSEPLPAQNKAVKNVVIHEEYQPGILFNDIALLFLESPVDLAPHIATICLPEQGESMDNRQCVASGWGKDNFGKEGKYQVILKKVELPIVSKQRCVEALRQTRLGKHFRLHSSFICAGGVPGKDTCKGDGGGPLVCPVPGNPNMYVQAGMVAWGIGCGTETPGVYVDVAQFRNWIDNKISIFNIDIRNSPQTKTG